MKSSITSLGPGLGPGPTRRHRGERRGGFTIVEVVLAMFILLIGMTSILGLLSFGAALSRTAKLRNESAYAVETIVADLEETFFPLVELEDGTLVVGEPEDILDRPVPGRPGLRYSARAVPDPAGAAFADGPLIYRVDVEVSWSNQGSKRSTKFRTILLREVPFGERLRRQFVQVGYEPQKAASLENDS